MSPPFSPNRIEIIGGLPSRRGFTIEVDQNIQSERVRRVSGLLAEAVIECGVATPCFT